MCVHIEYTHDLVLLSDSGDDVPASTNRAPEGGLIGYGPLIVSLFRDTVSRQLAKLLRGAQPADLPVEQPSRFELVINLKTAKAIGHDVPGALVLRADKVIE